MNIVVDLLDADIIGVADVLSSCYCCYTLAGAVVIDLLLF
jgi:hypothetical protein